MCGFTFGHIFLGVRVLKSSVDENSGIQIVKVRFLVFKSPAQNLRRAAISFVMSASPHGTTRLPLDRFS